MRLKSDSILRVGKVRLRIMSIIMEHFEQMLLNSSFIKFNSQIEFKSSKNKIYEQEHGEMAAKFRRNLMFGIFSQWNQYDLLRIFLKKLDCVLNCQF